MSDQTHDFAEVIQTAVSRRTVLFGGSAAVAAFLSPQLTGVAGANGGKGKSGLAGQPSGAGHDVFDFVEVGRTTADTVTVPAGYRADVLYSWGDSIDGKGSPFKGTDITLDEQLASAGQSHDGMYFFPLPSRGPNQRGLLVLNHEITETEFLFADDEANWDEHKSKLSMAAQGVSVIEVKRTGNQWKVMPSKFARRITSETPMELTGPAAGHALLQTSYDPAGTTVLGTANNCANGYTPWGTYLTCEENFNAYFGSTVPGFAPTPLMANYGLSADNFGPPLYLTEDRFDLAKEPNESNRFGWVVEIDPMDPTSTPKKRTALGRCKHENAELVVDPATRRVIVYSGDDERGQFLYKFVSDLTVDDADGTTSPLDVGTLHVGRFENGAVDGDYAGVGTWIPLTPSTPGLEGWSQAEILIDARGAATIVGATPMDRPEWVAADPTSVGTVYCTLTNSNASNRPDGSNDANPRPVNPNGHIIRWIEDGNDPKATTFTFDIFVLAGDPEDAASQADPQRVATEGIPAFTDPDGLWFDGAGNLVIQTDGGQPSGLNNQMLLARTSGSHVDDQALVIKRFLVGPIGCEVTGITQTPDGTAIFVNIQHPGEGGSGSDWPDKVGGLPRSSTVVVRREDGAPVVAPYA